MSTFTENYDLIKPDAEDYYDVQDFNENFDTIDAQLAQTAAAAEAVGESVEQMDAKIGTPEDTSSDTIFGKLNAGSSFIKSIQVVNFDHSLDGTTYEFPIEPVNPSRCIIIAERLYDSSAGNQKVIHTLNESSLTVIPAKLTSHSVYVRYQIIEFY